MMIIKMVFVFLSGKAFHKLVEAGCKDFFSHSGTKALEGSASDVGGYGLTHISGQI